MINMLSIILVAFSLAATSTEASSINSYAVNPSAVREYEYIAGGYLGSKPSYSDLSAAYVASAGSSPYAKSDTRYAADSTSDGSDPRASLTSGGSFYKSKYGNEAVVNSLRPSYPGSSSEQQQQVHYSSPDYAANAASAGSSAGSSSASSSSSSSGSSPTSIEYTSNSGSSYPSSSSSGYGERTPEYQQYVSSDSGSSSHGLQTEYPPGPNSRPASSSFPGYATSIEYSARPSYAHGSLSSPVSSSLSVSDGGPARHPSYTLQPASDEYSHHHSSLQQPSAYKTYLMSAGPPAASYPTGSKYQSVFGAIKSLFGSASSALMAEPAPSASHMPAYLPSQVSSSSSSSPSAYYSGSPVHGPSAPHHHHPASAYTSASAPGSASSGYYLSSGPGASSLGYGKSYPPMRLVSGYSGSSPAAGKIIVVRESTGSHSPSYPGSAASLIASPSSYAIKASRISAYPPTGHAYLSAAPSSMAYSSGPPSSYPGGYQSSPSFSAGHAGGPYLGYSA